MKLDELKKYVVDGLNYYKIEESDYKLRCEECIEFIIKNNYISKFNDLYNKLYLEKNDEIRHLWKKNKLEEVIGIKSHPFVTNLLLLVGYKIHESNLKKYEFDQLQIATHKNRVRDSLLNDIYIKKYEGIRLSQMLWGIYFVKLRIIEVGRLQYEYETLNPITNEKELCIKIHIPSGEKLNIDDVKASLFNSKSMILKYFNLNNFNYYCASWLLSPQIRKLLNDDSNIAKFYDLFEINYEYENIKDIFKFVFGNCECDDYNELIATTSIQIKIKELLLSGDIINNGIGILKYF